MLTDTLKDIKKEHIFEFLQDENKTESTIEHQIHNQINKIQAESQDLIKTNLIVYQLLIEAKYAMINSRYDFTKSILEEFMLIINDNNDKIDVKPIVMNLDKLTKSLQRIANDLRRTWYKTCYKPYLKYVKNESEFNNANDVISDTIYLHFKKDISEYKLDFIKHIVMNTTPKFDDPTQQKLFESDKNEFLKNIAIIKKLVEGY